MSAPMKQIIFVKMSSFKAQLFNISAVFLILISIKCSLSRAETDFYSFSANDIHGKPVSLEDFRGKPSLVVNVASRCGYTNQHYSELQWIYENDDFKDKLNILAFPCNQFGAQETGSAEQIEKVAREMYGTTFPLFTKIEVTGENAHPIYKFLAESTGKEPTWNFWKYLVDHNGKPLHAWGPKVTVLDIYHQLYQIVRKTEKIKADSGKTPEVKDDSPKETMGNEDVPGDDVEDEDDIGVEYYEDLDETKIEL